MSHIVCIAILPVEQTPVPTGASKTGYMIKSVVAAIVHNIKAQMSGDEPAAAAWNAVCLADAGNEGPAFVALPGLPPGNVTWAKKGRWVHLAKPAFENVRSGDTDPVYERYASKTPGIERLRQPAPAGNR